MRKVNRFQVTFHTVEGDTVSSTQLEVDGTRAEYIPVASLAFLTSFEYEEILDICDAMRLITNEIDGIEWIKMRSALTVMSQITNATEAIINTP